MTIAMGVVVGLLAGAIYALWRSHEEAKAERVKWQRIASAQSESRERIHWPPARGPKGFSAQRRKA